MRFQVTDKKKTQIYGLIHNIVITNKFYNANSKCDLKLWFIVLIMAF